MAHRDIKHKRKNLTIHKSVTTPHFNESTVLVTSTWDYVDLWLKRAGKKDARFFWSQARSFYDATKILPKTSAPLTAYYCFLNATKTLLLAKGVQFSDEHGVSGYTKKGHTSLSNEQVKFKTSGVLPALCRHLGEPADESSYSLKDLLYNLPGIHRAFNLTYSSDPELFIPLTDPKIVKSAKTNEAWFCAKVTGQYATSHTMNKLPDKFERDISAEDAFLIRSANRFNWKPNQTAQNLAKYKTYHTKLRKNIYYINGAQRLWYLKRAGNILGLIQRSSMTIAFAAMHKLSEMARYEPDKLSRHFDCQHNWLLSEFISSASAQFIDEISSELTGHEFMLPGRN
jgi:hypothetical protein